jgi:hypothetical protein
MASLTITSPRIDSIRDAFAKAPGDITKEVHATMEVAVGVVETAVKENTPVGATGLARRSMATDIRGEGVDLTGRVFSRDEPIKIASLETGRKPGKMPPIGPIMLWARRKFGDAAAASAAYAIQRKIGKRGTKGAKMFQKAVKATEKDVATLFERRITAAVRRVLG